MEGNDRNLETDEQICERNKTWCCSRRLLSSAHDDKFLPRNPLGHCSYCIRWRKLMIVNYTGKKRVSESRGREVLFGGKSGML